jgi:hypothetical protein
VVVAGGAGVGAHGDRHLEPVGPADRLAMLLVEADQAIA